jgi:hypothetical protein
MAEGEEEEMRKRKKNQWLVDTILKTETVFIFTVILFIDFQKN